MDIIRRIGLLADTHSAKPDGSDLPDAVLGAFSGVDLIVHLGDTGRAGILGRLGAVAPVWVKVEDKGYAPFGTDDSPARVVEGATSRVGLTFGIHKLDKSLHTADDGTIVFGDKDLSPVFARRFGGPVEVVAFGGTHIGTTQHRDGVHYVNPGSPNMPTPPHPGSVAVLDVSGPKPEIRLIPIG